jgi:hypothetical protein
MSIPLCKVGQRVYEFDIVVVLWEGRPVLYLKVACGVDLRCPNDCNVVNDSEAKVAR